MSVRHVDVHEAHRLQTDDGYTYVDVRSVPEYERGHPEGAHNVPLLHFDTRTGQMKPNPEFLAVMQANYAPDAKLLIGCQMGGRSAPAGDVLAQVSRSAFSHPSATFRSWSVPWRRPTSWSPHGRFAGVRPHGIEIAGWPVALKSCVRRSVTLRSDSVRPAKSTVLVPSIGAGIASAGSTSASQPLSASSTACPSTARPRWART